MVSPTFLHELSIEQREKMSQEDLEQTIKAEQLYFQNRQKKIYCFAVNGSKTKNDGLVNASATQHTIDGLAIARVGDEVIYADGTTSKIISGAGTACIVDGLSVAVVGSRLENGDEIVDSPNNAVAINIFKGDDALQGFLVSEQDAKNG